MRQVSVQPVLAAALLLAALASALPHEDHESMDMSMDMKMDDSMGHNQTAAAPTTDPAMMSYFAYGKHTGTILAHIILMVLAWCFVLPVGKISGFPQKSSKTDRSDRYYRSHVQRCEV